MFEDGDGRQGRDGGAPGPETDARGPGEGGVGVLDRHDVSAPPTEGQPPEGGQGPGLSAGELMAGRVRQAGVLLGEASQTDAVRCGGGELVATLAELDVLDRGADALKVRMAIEALSRGLHLEAGMGAIDWLAEHCPWLSRAQVGDLALLAQQAAAHQPIVDQVLAGMLPLRRAARVLRALGGSGPQSLPRGTPRR